MEEIINYVMETPGNTNPNVLRSQLQGMVSNSSGGVLVAHQDVDGILDKTWKEIYNAPFVVLKIPTEGGTNITAISFLGGNESEYVVSFGEETYSTNSEDGYPVLFVPQSEPGGTR